MTASGNKGRVPGAPAGSESSPFGSVLVPVDLTPLADRVLARVALLPLADDARITLLHVVSERLPARDQRSAARDARQALADEARHIAAMLPASVHIEPMVRIGTPAVVIADVAGSEQSELVVMGSGSGRTLRAEFLGFTAQRVIRRCQLPILVVRLPARAPYHRPAVALDLDELAHEVLGLLYRVLPPPRPRVTIIHAYEAPYPELLYPSVSEDEGDSLREERQMHASLELSALLASSLHRARVRAKDAPAWKAHIRHGSPQVVIEKIVKKAATDLLLLGTHGYSDVAHMFLGTVAGDVLRDVACDVLVVPPRLSV